MTGSEGDVKRRSSILGKVSWYVVAERVLYLIAGTVVIGPSVIREWAEGHVVAEQLARALEAYPATVGVAVAGLVAVIRRIRGNHELDQALDVAKEKSVAEGRLAAQVGEILARVKSIQGGIR